MTILRTLARTLIYALAATFALAYPAAVLIGELR